MKIFIAAPTAAIVASLAGKANSISTSYMLDIHQKFINSNLSEKQTVWLGRVAMVVSFIIALVISPMLKNFGQGFEYIQEYTGFISPGILCIFLLGMFWKGAMAGGALISALLSIPLSMFFKYEYSPIPFLNRMGIVFWICITVHVTISLLGSKGQKSPKAFAIDSSWFHTPSSFRLGALALCELLATVYTVFWYC